MRVKTHSALGALLLLAGCAVVPGGRARALDPYVGRPAQLFEDDIEARAVGLELEGRVDPRRDPVLRERATKADAVLRVKVESLTGRDGEGGRSYDLDLRTLEKLTGSDPPAERFTLHVQPRGLAVGLLKSVESTLGGKTMVAFVKAFSGSGEAELHFHLAVDSPEEASAVKDAAALYEAR